MIFWVSPADLRLLGAVGIFRKQTASSCTLQPGHFSAQERLQRLEEPAGVSLRLLIQ